MHCRTCLIFKRFKLVYYLRLLKNMHYSVIVFLGKFVLTAVDQLIARLALTPESGVRVSHATTEL